MKVHGSPFPDPDQLLLLQAASLEGTKAIAAWAAWQASYNLADPLDNGSFRTLPLLYRQLSRILPEEPLLGKLKFAYHQSWYRNQKLLHRGAEVLKLLNDNQIDTIVLKGAALSIMYYEDLGIRPMADLDVMVRPEDARKALALLQQEGWIADDSHHIEYNLRYGRAMGFRDSSGSEFDLHWHPFFELHSGGAKEFWDKAVPLQLLGVNTLALDPAAALLHVMVHGLRWNPEPPIRWIPDSLAILGSGKEIDWQRLLELTQKFRVILQVRTAVDYLRAHFDARFPQEFLTALETIPAGFVERYVFREHLKQGAESLPEEFYPRLHYLFGVYLRQSERKGMLPNLAGFSSFILFRTSGKNRAAILWYYLRRALRKN